MGRWEVEGEAQVWLLCQIQASLSSQKQALTAPVSLYLGSYLLGSRLPIGPAAALP